MPVVNQMTRAVLSNDPTPNSISPARTNVVGAVDALNNELQESSSAGPNQILFDNEGNRIPESERPDPTGVTFLAPDNLNNTFFGQDDPVDGDADPKFSGTSAATPAAAGTPVAATPDEGTPIAVAPEIKELAVVPGAEVAATEDTANEVAGETLVTTTHPIAAENTPADPDTNQPEPNDGRRSRDERSREQDDQRRDRCNSGSAGQDVSPESTTNPETSSAVIA